MIDDGGDGRLLVPLRRSEQRPQPGRTDDADRVDAKGEDEDVLPDDADGLTRQAQQQGQRTKWIAHEDHVARLGGDVGARAADGQADIGTGQGGRVVDAVAHYGHTLAGLLPSCDEIRFLPRQQLGMNLAQLQGSGKAPGDGGAVAGQQSDVMDAQRAQFLEDGRRLGAQPIARPMAPSTRPCRATRSTV